VISDKLFSYDIPAPAVINYEKDSSYIFCIIIKSLKGERFIEPRKYSWIWSKFYTPGQHRIRNSIFFLTSFRCINGKFVLQWDAPIPSHGGFNMMHYKKWDKFNIPFIQMNFYYRRGTGHINIIIFLLMELIINHTYWWRTEVLNFKRTIADVNDDRFPDYYEHIYYDLWDRVFTKDSVTFIWNLKNGVSINTRNKKQTRLYWKILYLFYRLVLIKHYPVVA